MRLLSSVTPSRCSRHETYTGIQRSDSGFCASRQSFAHSITNIRAVSVLPNPIAPLTTVRRCFLAASRRVLSALVGSEAPDLPPRLTEGSTYTSSKGINTTPSPSSNSLRFPKTCLRPQPA